MPATSDAMPARPARAIPFHLLINRLVRDPCKAFEEWGDLNVLTLDLTREEVNGHMAARTERFRELADPLRADHPHLIHYLERQIAFCSGFYAVTDYWGAL